MCKARPKSLGYTFGRNDAYAKAMLKIGRHEGPGAAYLKAEGGSILSDPQAIVRLGVQEIQNRAGFGSLRERNKHMSDTRKIIIDGKEVEVEGRCTLIQACERSRGGNSAFLLPRTSVDCR